MNVKLARNGISVVLVITNGGHSNMTGLTRVDGGGSERQEMVSFRSTVDIGKLCHVG